MKRNFPAWEPWLLLPAGPPLVLRELFPLWAQVAALLWIAGLWGARRWAKGRWGRRTPLDLPILLLLLTLPGAVTAAEDVTAALSRVESLLFAIALYYALANAIRWPRHAWSAVTWLLLSGGGVAVVGALTVSWLDKYPLFEPIIARLPHFASSVPHPTLQGGVHPNELAGVLVLFVPLAVAILMWPAGEEAPAKGAQSAAAEEEPSGSDFNAPNPPGGRRRRRPSLAAAAPVRPAAVVCLVLTVPVLVLTQSRGAWLGLAASLVLMTGLYVWRHFRRARGETIAATGLALILLAAVAIPMAAYTSAVLDGNATPTGLAGVGAAIAARVSAGRGPGGLSATGRLQLWREAIAMVKAHPLVGIGLNNFPLVHGRRPEYGGGFVYQGLPHAHNTLLQSALDYGLPGLLAVLGVYGGLAWVALRAYRRLKATAMEPIVVGVSFGLMAHAMHGLVDAVAIGAKPGFLPWAFAGVLVGLRYRSHGWVGRRRPSKSSGFDAER